MRFSIGQVAQELGVATSTLRYYEAEGLAPPAMRVSGRRRYLQEDVDVFRLLLLGRDLGFGIADLKKLKSLIAAQGNGPEQRQAFLLTLMTEIDERIATLTRKRELLKTALACGCRSAKSCQSLQSS